MGAGFSHSFPCFNPNPNRRESEPIFDSNAPLDETLGHSFCYVRSSARFLSPTNSDRFEPTSPSQSTRFDDPVQKKPTGFSETGFRSISGASVSANSFTPVTVEEDAIDSNKGIIHRGGIGNNILEGFESTSSFSALPLQRAPRGASFMSGPIERGALSGPLDPSGGEINGGGGGGVPFSAPLGGMYGKKKSKKGISVIRKALNRNFSRPWVVPMRNFVKKEMETEVIGCESNVQWALGKAGEDRVHVVVSEELGYLFVGIYDGFNGPDGPEFLMSHLYKAMYDELEGLFWQNGGEIEPQLVKKVTFEGEEIEVKRRRLWEFLVEDDLEYGIGKSSSDRFAFSVDRTSTVKRERKLGPFCWRFGLDGKKRAEEGTEVDNVEIDGKTNSDTITNTKRKVGLVDHNLVLSAMSRALEKTEEAYLDMTDRVLDRYPELALMGSCLLVALMRDDDVYVMNVGDSRAIVAQHEQEELSYGQNSDSVNGDNIVEERVNESRDVRLIARQLSTDHSTNIQEEVIRIKNEHPDDNNCIVNGRVKGRLKVTRAFGAGFLKRPKLNDSLLEMFRNNYIGTAPYLSCSPSLRHHKLCPNDQFLVLSSDGLYQYFTNQEVVTHVQNFMEKFPEGDPAQHLIEELLFRAARKAGMDFHELLDIPQGDRRKYHDDVTVMVVSLEGRIWKSSGKYI